MIGLIGLVGLGLSKPRVCRSRIGSGSEHSAPALVNHEDGSAVLFLPAGLRKLGGALAWIRTYGAWERQDLNGLRRNLRVAVLLDPKNLHYWLNGARMLVYDVPSWGLDRGVPEEGSLEGNGHDRQRQAADEGLRLLQLAENVGLRSPWLAIESGSIHLFSRKDLMAAHAQFRRAALQPQAPSFAGRIAAECLRQAGHLRAAYDWLLEYQAYLSALEHNPRELAKKVLGSSPLIPSLLIRVPELEAIRSRIHQLELELEFVDKKHNNNHKRVIGNN